MLSCFKWISGSNRITLFKINHKPCLNLFSPFPENWNMELIKNSLKMHFTNILLYKSCNPIHFNINGN